MTFLKDLIDIPEHVGKGDFVFTLENAVDHPEMVLKNYVVTDQIRKSLDDALKQIEAAVDAGDSRATYLHGSFGSGKSHFMAVLYLLLSHATEARAMPELQDLVANHDDWLEGKTFMLVPVHMINSGATSVEEALLSAYVDRVQALHPEAAVPPVFVSQPILENAHSLRGDMGDEAFFAALNEGRTGEPNLGELGTPTWDAESFEAAAKAKPGEAGHDALVSSLVATLLSAYAEVARGNQFVGLDQGLNAASRHAKSLGYDGIVLFIDELILWLASRIADIQFVQKEAEKLATLRESAIENRPIPIASFVARQRDLADLIGTHYPGAERLGFNDALSFSAGRFDVIELKDRNLRAIAEKRVLKPKDSEAKAALDAAFDETVRGGGNAVEVLLGNDASLEEFRAVYPFSPAFIETLVAASSALQRERTAIRVMMQILSDRRDELEVGDVIPVGALFDALSGAAEPFSQGLKEQFHDAHRLYENRLRPLILSHAGLEPEASGALSGSARAEDLLVKTLLLAALIADAEPIRGLTASRAVALNLGTIATPIPGEESSTALAALRRLRMSVGQLQIQEDVGDPSVRIVLSEIDTDRIIESARGEHDNEGARRRLVRSIFRESLGLGDSEALFSRYPLEWRGIDREIEIAFENVRELPGERSKASGELWKLIIDFPFDSDVAGRANDQARIQQLRDEIESQTLFWLPAFVTNEVSRQMGVLITIEALLAGERLERHAAHLSASEREKARETLESQATQLRLSVSDALKQAYGLTTPKPDVIEGAETPVFETLEPTLDPRAPVAVDFKTAVESLSDQLLRHQFPDHPEFGERITPGKLRKVWELVRRATEQESRRLDDLERADRQLLKRIAEPLELGTMHEGPFVLELEWRDRFLRIAAERNADRPSVAQLRAWTDEPEPRGLTHGLQDLVILTYAALENRSFQLHGAPQAPTGPGELDDAMELVAVDLPTEEEWERARDRAAGVLGMTVPSLISAQNLDSYGSELQSKMADLVEPAQALLASLEGTLAPALGLNNTSDRVLASREASGLAEAIAGANPNDALQVLAAADIERSPQELGRTLARSREADQAITRANWELFGKARTLAENGNEKAKAALAPVIEAASVTELTKPLADALHAGERAATAVVVGESAAPAPPDVEPGAETHSRLSVDEASAILREIEHPEQTSVDMTIHHHDADGR